MKKIRYCLLFIFIVFNNVAVAEDLATLHSAYDWDLPPSFPFPVVPDDNLMSDIKVKLGRYLFYDRRLSINGQYSCASCHQQDKAFSDGLSQAVGATQEKHTRNTMSLVNVAFNTSLTWASNDILTLEDQIRIPLFNREPVEMGLTDLEEKIMVLLRADERYRSWFTQAFPADSEVFTIDNIIKAIAAFVRTLISGDSIYDRLVYKYVRVEMSESAWRGMRLFYSEKTNCSQCHKGFNFSGPVNYRGAMDVEPGFHNTGLYSVNQHGAYPVSDQGLYSITSSLGDMGKCRAPSLRNIEYSAPYMHDGSIDTLEAVIDHYATAGRTSSPIKDSLITGFEIRDESRRDLLNFLLSLLDTSFVTNTAFSNLA